MTTPENKPLPQTDAELAAFIASGVIDYLNRPRPEDIKAQLIQNAADTDPDKVVKILIAQVGDVNNNLAVAADIKKHPCTADPKVMEQQYQAIDAAIARENPLSMFR